MVAIFTSVALSRYGESGPDLGMDDRDVQFKNELTSAIPSIRAFARLLTGDKGAGDELAQKALVIAWQSRSAFARDTNLKASLFTILRGQFYSDRSRAHSQAPQDQNTAKGIVRENEGQVLSAQLSDTGRVLRGLPDEQREALVLVGPAGFSYADAAAICKCALGTVKSRVCRARKALMRALNPDGAVGPARETPVE